MAMYLDDVNIREYVEEGELRITLEVVSNDGPESYGDILKLRDEIVFLVERYNRSR